MNLMTLAVEMSYSFRTDKSAGTCDQYFLWLHLKGSLLPMVAGPAPVL